MPFFMTVEALNLEDIFLFLFDSLSMSKYCRRDITITLSLAFLVPRTFLVVLVFLASLALVDRRLLVLATRYVSKRNISKLSLSGVLLLLFHRFVPSKIL